MSAVFDCSFLYSILVRENENKTNGAVDIVYSLLLLLVVVQKNIKIEARTAERWMINPM